MMEVVWQESSKPNGVEQVIVIITAAVVLRSKLWRFSVALAIVAAIWGLQKIGAISIRGESDFNPQINDATKAMIDKNSIFKF